MKYDKSDRLIFTQDGNQSGSQWTFHLYDKYGREAVMGIVASNTVTNPSTIAATATYTGGSSLGGYTTSLSLSNATPLKVNYYDGYGYITDFSLPTNMGFNSSNGGDAAFSTSDARGLLTGTRVCQLNTPTNVSYTSFYYGKRERMVQSHQQNHLGGKDDEYQTYNFTGTVATKKHVHSASGQSTQTELYTHTYDNEDRLLNTTYKLNSNTAITLDVKTYDAVGRLGTRKPMNQETVTYGYNVRSWLTGISSTNFTQTLAYNSTVNGLTPNPVYHGGNIAAQRWQSSQDTHSWSFQYGYYQTGFLMDANCFIGTNTYPSFYTEYYYDKMGNLDEVWRTGYISDGVYGRIDDLCPTFDGNRYTRVDDNDYVQNYPYNNGYHFVDNASQDDEYTYDNNGNMTKDLNRFISSIQYNLLNLPQSITYSTNKSATYTYDAAGRKLKVVYTNPGLTIDYCGNMIYEGGTLKQIQVDGGYVTFSGTTPVYHYYLKDHQGNNCVVVNKTGTVEEVNHYYPFGLLFGESINPDTQRFKYNGKELDMMHGLHMYDYGARQYDPLLCRFTTMDPMCEKYYHLSPYAYCGNNPVNAIDPDGKDDYEINKDGYIRNITSFWEKVKEIFGCGNGKDRIFMKGSEDPSIVLPEGSIINMEDNLEYSKIEIKDGEIAEEVFQTIISDSDVEWAHVRHTDKSNSGTSLIINNHKDNDVSKSASFANTYKNRGEHISLFEHSHPIPKDIKYSNVPTFNMIISVSGANGEKGDINTAKKYPGTVFRVYDLNQKRIQYYDGNGIKKTVKWK